MTTANIFLAILIVLKLLDWYTTRTVIAHDRNGTTAERNLWLRRLFDGYGVDRVMSVNVALISAIGWRMCANIFTLPDGTTFHGMYGVLVLDIYYARVIFNNWQSMPK